MGNKGGVITDKRYRTLTFLLLGTGCAGVLFLLLAKLGWGIPCLFYQITGLQCPGCGNSRVILALLRLDLIAGFQANPLFPLEFFYIGWVAFHGCKGLIQTGKLTYKPPCPWLDIVCLVLILSWGIIRNLI